MRIPPGEKRIEVLSGRVDQGFQLWNAADENGDERERPLRIENMVEKLCNGEFGAERIDRHDVIRENLFRLRQYAAATARLKSKTCATLAEARGLALRAFGLDGLAWEEGSLCIVGYFKSQLVAMGSGHDWNAAFANAWEHLRATIWRKEHP